MKLPHELDELVESYLKLNKKTLFGLEEGVFLMSNRFDGPPTNPMFARGKQYLQTLR